jgi:hypothetical protein
MTELDELLEPLPPGIGALSRSLADLIEAVPGLSGAVRLGWRSINFRHEQAGHICAIFPHADRVSLYFEHGRLLDDPDGLLEGDLKKGRFVKLVPDQPVPGDAILVLVAEAIALRS